MASSYPGALDSLANVPTNMNTAPNHSTQHNTLRDMVQATQAAIGVTGSSRLVQRFATEAARNAAIPSPTSGMLCWVETPTDTSVAGGLYVHYGSWLRVALEQWYPSAAAITMGAAWTAFGAGYALPSAVKHERRIELEGVMVATTTITGGSTIATIELGKRPTSAIAGPFVCASNNADKRLRLSVHPTGAIVTLDAVNSGEYVSLAGISFHTHP